MTNLNFNNGYYYNNPMMPQQGGYYEPQAIPQGYPTAYPQTGYQDPSNGNFSANQLQQDQIDLSTKSEEPVKENFIFKGLRKLGVKNPKKLLTSIGLATATVVGLAVLGNKSVNKMADAGQAVDDFFLKGKGKAVYEPISNAINGLKTRFTNFMSKPGTTRNDIYTTFKSKFAKPVVDIARGYGQGFKSIFSLTPVDTLGQVVKNKQGAVVKQLSKEFGEKGIDAVTQHKLAKIMKSADPSDLSKAAQTMEEILKKSGVEDAAKIGEITTSFMDKMGAANTGLKSSFAALFGDKADDIFSQITGAGGAKIEDGNIKFCKKTLTDAIANNFGIHGADKEKQLLELFKKAQKAEGTFNGKDLSALSEFINVDMKNGGLVGAWWPVNAIDTVGKKIFKGNWKGFCRGDFFDSMIKVDIANGSLAKTGIGRLVQKSILIPTESVSNFVNDKSGMGVALGAMTLIPLFNNVQDAPKGKKGSTIANDLVGSIGSIAITTPMAFAATYGLASLARIEGKTLTGSILKKIGSFFHMGLSPKTAAPVNLIGSIKADGFKGLGGAISRMPKAFAQSFTGKAGGALRFALMMFGFSALFSKPLTKAIQKVFGKPYDPNEAKKSNTPAINMTQEEMIAKLQAHPEVVQAIESDPQLMAAIQKDPTLLVQLLSQLPDTPQQQYPSGMQQPMYPDPNTFQGNYQNQPQQNPWQMQPQMYPQQQAPMYDPYQQYQPQNPWQMQPQAYPQQQMYNPYQQGQMYPQYNNGFNYQQNPMTNPYGADSVPEPARSYVPSSRPVTLQNAMNVNGEPITDQKVQNILMRADKAEQDAMRFF